VQDGNGISDFEALQSAMRRRPHSIILYAFDLMHLDGKDLRQRALSERRSILKSLLGSDEESRIQYSEEFHGDGAAFFKACADKRLEGMVSKLASSRYRSGRSKTWLKTKCFTESAFVIIGTDRDRNTSALRALLARADRHALSYAGAAFIGLRGDAWHELRERLQRIARL
jgi:bifunctional non-homologous end joining protein LigD